LYIWIFSFLYETGRHDFGLNNSKHSLNSTSSWFDHASHSDLLMPYRYIKGREFLGYLVAYNLLKKDSASWN
jgi:hypothetical protein